MALYGVLFLCPAKFILTKTLDIFPAWGASCTPKGKYFNKEVQAMKKTKIAISQEFKKYNKVMSKLNVYGSTLDNLNSSRYTITLTTKTWTLGSRKAFSKQPQTVETEQITAREYACYISSVEFFQDRISKQYTPAGFIPVRLTCYNPDKIIKIQRTFHIAHNAPPWD